MIIGKINLSFEYYGQLILSELLSLTIYSELKEDFSIFNIT
jgi:hypothetical protein